MEHISNGARGLGVLMQVNKDRVVYVIAIGCALWLGTLVGSTF